MEEIIEGQLLFAEHTHSSTFHWECHVVILLHSINLGLTNMQNSAVAKIFTDPRRRYGGYGLPQTLWKVQDI